MARTTVTGSSASSARRRVQGGRSGQSPSSASNRSPTTVESAFSPTWRFPNNPGTGLDYLDDCYATPELEWGSEEAWEGGQLRTQQLEFIGRTADGMKATWPLLLSEERKKR